MRRTYTFKTPIRSAGDFTERLLSMENALVSDDPIPYPPGHDILLNVDDDNRVRIRHYAPPTEVASPILQLDFTAAPYGTEIQCEVLDADTPFSAAERAALSEIQALTRAEPDATSILLRRLWRWLDTRFLRPWQRRRGMERYGKKLLALVKDVAEENGIIGDC